MRFAIFTHVLHYQDAKGWAAYGPYVHEMNIWARHLEEIVILSPVKSYIDPIDKFYKGAQIDLHPVPAVSLTSPKNILLAAIHLPSIIWKIARIMRKADHIHLRCPGNVGLLACLVQVLFPKKPKTAKYAGNWDPDSRQPWSYRLQKWILSNTFFTRNMQVLVYGDWPRQSKNIKPFFTASYSDSDRTEQIDRSLEPPYRFLFVGTLTDGKRPVYAARLVDGLLKKVPCRLDIYGEGAERTKLEVFIKENQLEGSIKLHGNRPSGQIKEAYQNAHFLILPSRSEGWPKVVAEAMWWGVVPVVTKISCVPWMIDHGDRGILLDLVPELDEIQLLEVLSDRSKWKRLSTSAESWSRSYTLDRFEKEIAKLLQ